MDYFIIFMDEEWVGWMRCESGDDEAEPQYLARRANARWTVYPPDFTDLEPVPTPNVPMKVRVQKRRANEISGTTRRC